MLRLVPTVAVTLLVFQLLAPGEAKDVGSKFKENNDLQNQPSSKANPTKRDELKSTNQLFNIPSQEEIERLIKEKGFFMAAFTKLMQLNYGMVSVPFRWVKKVFEFMVTIIKLAAESLKQHEHSKRS